MPPNNQKQNGVFFKRRKRRPKPAKMAALAILLMLLLQQLCYAANDDASSVGFSTETPSEDPSAAYVSNLRDGAWDLSKGYTNNVSSQPWLKIILGSSHLIGTFMITTPWNDQSHHDLLFPMHLHVIPDGVTYTDLEWLNKPFWECPEQPETSSGYFTCGIWGKTVVLTAEPGKPLDLNEWRIRSGYHQMPITSYDDGFLSHSAYMGEGGHLQASFTLTGVFAIAGVPYSFMGWNACPNCGTIMFDVNYSGRVEFVSFYRVSEQYALITFSQVIAGSECTGVSAQNSYLNTYFFEEVQCDPSIEVTKVQIKFDTTGEIYLGAIAIYAPLCQGYDWKSDLQNLDAATVDLSYALHEKLDVPGIDFQYCADTSQTAWTSDPALPEDYKSKVTLSTYTGMLRFPIYLTTLTDSSPVGSYTIKRTWVSNTGNPLVHTFQLTINPDGCTGATATWHDTFKTEGTNGREMKVLVSERQSIITDVVKRINVDDTSLTGCFTSTVFENSCDNSPVESYAQNTAVSTIMLFANPSNQVQQCIVTLHLHNKQDLTTNLDTLVYNFNYVDDCLPLSDPDDGATITYAYLGEAVSFDVTTLNNPGGSGCPSTSFQFSVNCSYGGCKGITISAPTITIDHVENTVYTNRVAAGTYTLTIQHKLSGYVAHTSYRTLVVTDPCNDPVVLNTAYFDTFPTEYTMYAEGEWWFDTSRVFKDSVYYNHAENPCYDTSTSVIRGVFCESGPCDVFTGQSYEFFINSSNYQHAGQVLKAVYWGQWPDFPASNSTYQFEITFIDPCKAVQIELNTASYLDTFQTTHTQWSAQPVTVERASAYTELKACGTVITGFTCDCGCNICGQSFTENSNEIFTLHDTNRDHEGFTINIIYKAYFEGYIDYAVEHTWKYNIVSPCNNADLITLSSTLDSQIAYTMHTPLVKTVDSTQWSTVDNLSETECGPLDITFTCSNGPCDDFTEDSDTQFTYLERDQIYDGDTVDIKWRIGFSDYSVTYKDHTFTVTLTDPCLDASIISLNSYITNLSTTFDIYSKAEFEFNWADTHTTTLTEEICGTKSITFACLSSPCDGVFNWVSSTQFYFESPSWDYTLHEEVLSIVFTFQFDDYAITKVEELHQWTIDDPCVTASVLNFNEDYFSNLPITYSLYNPDVITIDWAQTYSITAPYDAWCGTVGFDYYCIDTCHIYAKDSDTQFTINSSDDLLDQKFVEIKYDISHTRYPENLITRSHSYTIIDPCDDPLVITLEMTYLNSLIHSYDLFSTYTTYWDNTVTQSLAETEFNCGTLEKFFTYSSGPSSTIFTIITPGSSWDVYSEELSYENSDLVIQFESYYKDYQSTSRKFDYLTIPITNTCKDVIITPVEPVEEDLTSIETGDLLDLIIYPLDNEIRQFKFTEYARDISYCPMDYTLHLLLIDQKSLFEQEILETDPNNNLFTVDVVHNSGEGLLTLQNQGLVHYFVGNYTLRVKASHQSQSAHIDIPFVGVCPPGNIDIPNYGQIDFEALGNKVDYQLKPVECENCLACNIVIRYELYMQDGSELIDVLSYDPTMHLLTFKGQLPAGGQNENLYTLQLVFFFDDYLIYTEMTEFDVYIFFVPPPIVVIANTAPAFVETFESQTVPVGEGWTFTLPEVIDDADPPESITYEVDLGDAEAFTTYADNSKTFDVAAGITTEENAGSYTLSITLTDLEGASSTHSISLNIGEEAEEDAEGATGEHDPNSDEGGEGRDSSGSASGEGKEDKAIATNNLSLDQRSALAADLAAKFMSQIMAAFSGGGGSDSEVEDPASKKIFKAPDVTFPSIEQATNTGVVVIRFDAKMRIGEISNEFLPMTAMTIPGPDSNVEDVQFKSVSLVSYNPERTITLQFEFFHPLMISSNDIPDQILIDLSPGKDVFIDANGNQLGEFTILKPWPRQVTSKDVADAIESTSNTSKTALVALMIGSYFVKGAMAQLMNLLGFLVIMTHMPLINAKVPASSSGFFAALFEAAKWDPIPYVDDVFEFFFGYIESAPLSTNFESLGYETTLVTNNLGSLYFLLFFQYVMFIIVVITSCLASKNKCQRFYSYLKRKDYKWNYFIGSLVNNYFVIAITATIGTENIKFGFATPSLAMNMSNFFCILHLALCGLTFIIITVLFMKAKRIQNGFKRKDISSEQRFEYFLQLKSFDEQFGTITEGMKTKNLNLVFGYHYVQMIRAILMSISVVFMNKVLIAQIFSIVIYTLGSIFYIGYTKPFIDSYNNKLTIFNEFLILITLYHMMCFTDFVPKPQTINMIGFSLNGVLAAGIAINLMIMLVLTVLAKIRKCKLNRIRKANLKIWEQRQKKLAEQEALNANGPKIVRGNTSGGKKLDTIFEEEKEHLDDSFSRQRTNNKVTRYNDGTEVMDLEAQDDDIIDLQASNRKLLKKPTKNISKKPKPQKKKKVKAQPSTEFKMNQKVKDKYADWIKSGFDIPAEQRNAIDDILQRAEQRALENDAATQAQVAKQQTLKKSKTNKKKPKKNIKGLPSGETTANNSPRRQVSNDAGNFFLDNYAPHGLQQSSQLDKQDMTNKIVKFNENIQFDNNVKSPQRQNTDSQAQNNNTKNKKKLKKGKSQKKGQSGVL